MATITPIAYKTGGGTIPGTTKVGNLYAGTTPQDYGAVGAANGVIFWATPNEDDGYVIAHEDPIGSHTGNTATIDIPAYVGFWRSEFLTENSFVQLTNNLFDQNFTGGTQAKTWLNNNGYWTSYKDVYQYNPLVTLSWPSSSTGYTLYTGGFTSFDDGASTLPITLPTIFETNNQSSNQLYLSTNGYFTIGTQDNGIRSSPDNPNPATMAANPGDNWLQPGLTNTDGDVQNWYYKTGTDSTNKFYVKNLVYAGTYGASTTPTSYIINFYRDELYEWLETRVKLNTRGLAGPYNLVSVAQGSSTTSRVWRGDLNGQNWTYMGTGTVVP